MLKDTHPFSGFSIDNLKKAKEFYGEKLGLDIAEEEMGLVLRTKGNNPIFIYEKDNHVPATFTILNFPVKNIDAIVEQLAAKGVNFEKYDLGNGAKTDEKGIMRGRAANMGPDIAWFKDPAGNILSILQN